MRHNHLSNHVTFDTCCSCCTSWFCERKRTKVSKEEFLKRQIGQKETKKRATYGVQGPLRRSNKIARGRPRPLHGRAGADCCQAAHAPLLAA
eukprot:2884841-Amphidinium_carterae.1